MHYDLDVDMYIDFVNMDVTFLRNTDNNKSYRATFNNVEELMGAIKEYILSCIKENEKEASPSLKAKYQKLLKELEK